MTKKTRFLTHGAIIAAIYVVLTFLQYMLLPETVSGMIQFRASEALCVLAFFTPAAIPGLTIGCLVFNITSSAVLPLDFLAGSAATMLASGGMRLCRRVMVRNYPLPGILLPTITNATVVGWELAFYIGGGFWLNALCVAIGETAVLLTLGSGLYYALKSHRLAQRLFGDGR